MSVFLLQLLPQIDCFLLNTTSNPINKKERWYAITNHTPFLHSVEWPQFAGDLPAVDVGDLKWSFDIVVHEVVTRK